MFLTAIRSSPWEHIITVETVCSSRLWEHVFPSAVFHTNCLLRCTHVLIHTCVTHTWTMYILNGRLLYNASYSVVSHKYFGDWKRERWAISTRNNTLCQRTVKQVVAVGYIIQSILALCFVLTWFSLDWMFELLNLKRTRTSLVIGRYLKLREKKGEFNL